MKVTHRNRWLLAAVVLSLAGTQSLLAAQPRSTGGKPKSAITRSQRSAPRPIADPAMEEMPMGDSRHSGMMHDGGPEGHSHGDWVEDPYVESMDCGDSNCGDCIAHGRCGSSGMFFGGAEYLLVRPRFSEAVAEVRRTITVNEGDESTTQVDQSVEYPYDYQSSYRLFLGYRLCDCGGEVQFTFWRLQGDAEVADGPAEVANGSRIILGQLGNNPCEGEFFRARSSVDANLYDLDFTKCIPLDSSSCCDPCGCPRWDVRWMAGVRIADINRNDHNSVDGSNSEDCLGVGDIDAEFSGAGPRIGLQGRRYLGCDGRMSVYAKGNGAILIGDYDARRVFRNQMGETDPVVTNIQEDHLTRLIPNGEIEVGGSWQIFPHAYLSAGWFFQAWFDLGSSQEIVGSSFGGLDDANILAFDGLFIRAEMMF